MFPLRDENPHPPGFRPHVTIILMIINVAVFFYEIAVTGQFWEFSGPNAGQMFYEWGAVPACITDTHPTFEDGSRVYCPAIPSLSLITSIFMHGGLMHLGGNMLFLWIFGDNIELKFGKLKFLGIYIIWGIFAGLAHLAVDPSSVIPAVGASGAISGILGAYLIMFPRAKILTFMMVFFFWRMMHISAKWFLPFWLVFQNILPFALGGFGIAGGGVAYMAHIGGFVIGLAFGYVYKKTHSAEFTYGTRYGWRGRDY
jgi:membrane associated rhomboid family serine protease